MSETCWALEKYKIDYYRVRKKGKGKEREGRKIEK